MRISIISILDSLFSAFLSFICTFLILNFYIEKPFSIIFGACFALLIFLIAFKTISNKTAKKSLDKQKSADINNMCNALCLLEPIKAIELFERAINRYGYRTLKKRGGIFIEEKNAFAFVLFSFDQITKTDIVRLFNKISPKEKAYVFGQSASNELLTFINRFNQSIEFVDAEKTFMFLSEANCLPKEQPLTKTKPLLLKNFFSRLFDRKNSKKFLGFGIFFLIMSAFVMVKFYYICCACVFLTLSLFCRLFGKEKIKG